MKKEILEQAVLDYINEKFKDKVLDKRVQTFFTYSELVDTVLSFAELLNKNIEELEHENEHLRIELEETKLAIDTWKKNADFWHKETKNRKFRKLAKERENQITELEKHRDLLAIAYQQESEGWKKSDKELKEAKEIIAEMLAYGIHKVEVTERAKKFLEEK